MSLDASLLRSSFELVIERQPQLTRRFYEIFFERYPQVRPMFGKNGSGQAEMLQQALIAVIEHLEDASWLEQTLGAMGRKHVEYGVRDEMYGWVGASLLAALAEAAGDGWTSDVEKAWTEAYGAISGLMLAGARADAAE
jgi:hemoglobin-like flavoprotein